MSLVATPAMSSDIGIGTILYSSHFNIDIDNPNESHNGLYGRWNKWRAGGFKNSYGNNSLFVTREIDFIGPLSLNLGLANGYEENINNIKGYLPIVAISYQTQYFWVSLNLQTVVVLGVEF